VSDLHKDFSWIGKNRIKNRGGGIGFICKNKSVSVMNDNLLNSMDDHFERLWIHVKVGAEEIALGVLYFPVDNDTKLRNEATDLHNELIQNIGMLQSYDNVLLLGDFNGKIEQFKTCGKHSSNGKLIENIIEVTELQLLNTDCKCTGKITWNRGPLESVIDYAMCSNGMYELIQSMRIDEDKTLSMGSDHNFWP
jgi:endonuclease/exonuclease/phosphatase family metal-dependent hydrolase